MMTGEVLDNDAGVLSGSLDSSGERIETLKRRRSIRTTPESSTWRLRREVVQREGSKHLQGEVHTVDPV